MEIGLSLGSNLRNRLSNLKSARKKILAILEIENVAHSPVYETEPVEVSPVFRDKSFLNAVLVVNCCLDAGEISAQLRFIEKEIGRSRTAHRNEPRLIDIDIIYAGKVSIHREDLIIPHPRWTERRFVVEPLAGIRPDMVIPGERRTVQQVLMSLSVTPRVVIFREKW